jgi:hypothetical protein
MHDGMRDKRFSTMHFLLIVFPYCAPKEARPAHKL